MKIDKQDTTMYENKHLNAEEADKAKDAMRQSIQE